MPTDLQIIVPEDGAPIRAWWQLMNSTADGDPLWLPRTAGEEVAMLAPDDSFVMKIGVFPGGIRRRIVVEGEGSVVLHLPAGSKQLVAAYVQRQTDFGDEPTFDPEAPPAPDAIDQWPDDRFSVTLAAGQRLIAVEVRDPKPPASAMAPVPAAPEQPALVPNVEAVGETALAKLVQTEGFGAVPDDATAFETHEEISDTDVDDTLLSGFGTGRDPES